MSVDSVITHKGETLSVAEWARKIGIKDKTIYMRLRLGWLVERALERPLQKGFLKTEKQKRDRKGDLERKEERAKIASWLKTQPSDVDERRDEGDIL